MSPVCVWVGGWVGGCTCVGGWVGDVPCVCVGGGWAMSSVCVYVCVCVQGFPLCVCVCAGVSCVPGSARYDFDKGKTLVTPETSPLDAASQDAHSGARTHCEPRRAILKFSSS